MGNAVHEVQLVPVDMAGHDRNDLFAFLDQIACQRSIAVLFAKRILEAMPDGTGVAMIDGKMQDDATVKQCHVMVELAKQLAARDAELREAYSFSEADLGG